MKRQRTRTSLVSPPISSVVPLLLLTALVLSLTTGCAPHRRGKIESGIELPPPTPRPSVARTVPEDPPTRPGPAWSDIDRSAPPAARVAAMAETFVGTPYLWGGATPAGFDCSGLVLFVYGKVGVNLPRRAIDQSRAGRVADLKKLSPGDLVFFRIDRDIISHVGIYVGGGEFVHAPGTGKNVRRDRIDDTWWRPRIKTVRRIVQG